MGPLASYCLRSRQIFDTAYRPIRTRVTIDCDYLPGCTPEYNTNSTISLLRRIQLGQAHFLRQIPTCCSPTEAPHIVWGKSRRVIPNPTSIRLGVYLVVSVYFCLLGRSSLEHLASGIFHRTTTSPDIGDLTPTHRAYPLQGMGVHRDVYLSGLYLTLILSLV